jgi:hypothetical protein
MLALDLVNSPAAIVYCDGRADPWLTVRVFTSRATYCVSALVRLPPSARPAQPKERSGREEGVRKQLLLGMLASSGGGGRGQAARQRSHSAPERRFNARQFPACRGGAMLRVLDPLRPCFRTPRSRRSVCSLNARRSPRRPCPIRKCASSRPSAAAMAALAPPALSRPGRPAAAEDWKGLSVLRPRFPVLRALVRRARASHGGACCRSSDAAGKLPLRRDRCEFLWPTVPRPCTWQGRWVCPSRKGARRDIQYWATAGHRRQVRQAAAGGGLLAVSAALRDVMASLDAGGPHLRQLYGRRPRSLPSVDRAEASAAGRPPVAARHAGASSRARVRPS